MDPETEIHELRRRLAAAEAELQLLRAKSDRAETGSWLLGREAELARALRIGGIAGFEVDLTRGLRGKRSPEYLRLHGLPPDQRLEEHEDWLRRVHPDDRAHAESTMRAAIAGTVPVYTSEYRIVRPLDGDVRWIAARADIERGEDGTPVRLVGAHVDITAQKRAQDALRESDTRHRLLIESWTQAVWETDAAGLVVKDSPSWRAYTGQTLEEWLGYGWLDAIHPDDRAYAERQWREAVAARRVVNAEFRVRAPDGGWRWTNVRAAPVLDADGQIEKWAGMNIDIDARKLAEAALRESEERQAFLVRLGDAMRESETPDRVIATSTRLLGEKLGASRIVFAEIDDPRGIAHIRQGWTAEGAKVHPAELKLADFGGPLLDDLRAGRTVRFDDVGMPPYERADLAALASIGIKAGLSVPLLIAGRFVVNLNVHQHEPRAWTDAEVALVENVAERIWAAVERARVEEALRDSNERFATMATAIDDVFYMTDLDRNALIYLSPGYERIWGRERAELEADLGVFVETIHPEDRPAFHAAKAAQARGDLVWEEYRVVRPDGTLRWVLDRSFPIPGTDKGRRSAGIASDITHRRQAEERVRSTEALLRQFGDASSDILWVRNAHTLRWEYLSPAFEAIYGMSVEAALTGDTMENWLGLIHEDDRAMAAAMLDRVRSGENATFEYRIRRRVDGAVRWLRNTDFPMRGAEGRIERIGGVGQDVTELKRIQEELQGSEQRLRNLMEGIPQLVWRALDGGEWTWSSPQWQRLTGQSLEASLGMGWLDAVHPDDRERTMLAWQGALANGGFEVEFRVCRADDGTALWHHTRAAPVRARDGRVVEWLGTTTDVQEMKALQERQGVMVAELQHRTRNLIAVVRSIAKDTMAQTGPSEAFRGEFDHRLEALSRVQGLLSRAEQEPVTIGALIRMELDALGASREAADQIIIAGPPVRIRNSVVQTLALALHELATNARKYGALSTTEGQLRVEWQLRTAENGSQRLRLEWIEGGAPQSAASEPVRRGYGRELIERALPYALKAKTEYVVGRNGVSCVIDIPLDRRGRPG